MRGAPDPYDAAPPSRRFTILFAVAMTLVALGWIWVWQVRTERLVVEPVPAVALTGVEMPTGEEPIRAEFMARLAASFARIRGLTITDPATLHGAASDSGTAGLVAAARALEVPHVLQGTLQRTERGYRLEVERLDAGTRASLGSVTAEAATHDEVIRAITAQLAMRLGLPVPDRD